MKVYIAFIALLLTTCTIAPEFERDSEFDLRSGIPYIKDAIYTVNRNGLLVNWVDGSLENDIFLLTQKIYDQSDTGIDSLIKLTELPGDRIFFLDGSGQFGYPYSVIISSIIYDKNENIKAIYSDSLSIDFGEINFRSYTKGTNLLTISWVNTIIPFSFIDQNILVEIDKGNGWEELENLPYVFNRFQYELDLLGPQDKFRISLTIPNFNGGLSRPSSFIVEID